MQAPSSKLPTPASVLLACIGVEAIFKGWWGFLCAQRYLTCYQNDLMCTCDWAWYQQLFIHPGSRDVHSLCALKKST